MLSQTSKNKKNEAQSMIKNGTKERIESCLSCLCGGAIQDPRKTNGLATNIVIDGNLACLNEMKTRH